MTTVKTDHTNVKSDHILTNPQGITGHLKCRMIPPPPIGAPHVILKLHKV